MKTTTLSILCLLLISCSSPQSSADSPTHSTIDSLVTAIDEEVVTIARDSACQYIQQPFAETEGKQFGAYLHNNDLVMIEEEEISARKATINRYYYKNQQLVLAAQYTLNPCADTLDICVAENRWYFQGTSIVREYVRSVALPLNEDGLLDEERWNTYLEELALEETNNDTLAGARMLRQSIQLQNALVPNPSAEG